MGQAQVNDNYGNANLNALIDHLGHIHLRCISARICVAKIHRHSHLDLQLGHPAAGHFLHQSGKCEDYCASVSFCTEMDCG